MKNKKADKKKKAEKIKEIEEIKSSEKEVLENEQKPWYKKKWPYIVLVVILFASGTVYAQIKKSQEGPEYDTVITEKGTLSQTVDATGNVESADEIDLKFETAGKIGQIYVNINDEVKKDDKLAELELGEYNARIAQARASVSKAYANLSKELAGSTDEYIATLEAKLKQAEANLTQIQAKYDNAIKSAQADVQTAEENLQLSVGGENSLIVQDSYDDMVALLQTTQSTLTNALREADNILGIDNTYADDDFEEILSALDLSKLKTANAKYLTTKDAKEDADYSINPLSTLSDNESIDTAVDITEQALVEMRDLLSSVSEVLDNTIPVGGLTQTELDTMKSTIQTARSNITSKYASLLDQKQAIESAKNSYDTYKIAYDSAVTTLENTRIQAGADIAAYQALVDQAQAGLNDAKNPPRDVDVAGYRAALWEAQANLNQIIANRDKAILKAPLDGVVGKIDAKVGELVTSQDVVMKLISPHFEVKVDIPETDIVKINLQDEAQIKLDAYGDDVVFMGTVTQIEKGETIIQDVVYYTVTVSLDDNSQYEILNGMTANIIFYTEEKYDVVFIPQRAVRTEEGEKYVRILDNGELKRVQVKTGLRGDGGMVEIIEGLSEGQEVVLKVLEEE
ncbi:MAG: efflux RND transporter periplasmic adaptor subunit [Candidatus Magasanikbacteria bacterium]|nr:efflux RND transporter periplasmic adaptor subunit [Candidatus Magasanikbacteria bacterium]